MTTHKTTDPNIWYSEPERTYNNQTSREALGNIIQDNPTDLCFLYGSTIIVKPVLEGFEKVLGRKFHCLKDCNNGCSCRTEKGCLDCPDFEISEETITRIKLKDSEIAETKIDTHPRIFVSNDIHYYIKPPEVSVKLSILKPKKVKIRQARIKLKLIL